MTDQLPLAEGFSLLNREQWQDLAAKALNRKLPEEKWYDGPSAEQKLITKTVDGIVINPLYQKPDHNVIPGLPGSMPFTRGSGVCDPLLPWDVRQLFDNPCATEADKEILTDLEGGVSSLWLKFGEGALDIDQLDKILDNVDLNLISFNLSSEDPKATAEKFLAFAKKAQVHHFVGNLGFDPISVAAQAGTTPDLSDAIAAAKDCIANYPKVAAIVVDVLPYHNAGAGDITELATAIATGITYLRALVDAGLSPDEAASQIQFRVAATADEFITICKLRALRRLWARVCEVAEVSEPKRGAYQHAVTSERMLTRDDPWVNMLRGTVSTFAAAVGGAEAITVLPFDHVVGYPDELGRRVARNTSVLLAEESHISAVIDPGGGSWYIESLTDQLATKAWEKVQAIEAEGDIIAALASGSLENDIKEVSAARIQKLSVRKLDITGVNQFPKDHEELIERKARPVKPETPHFAAHRDAEIFEALRDRSRKHLAATGALPKITLVCLGARRDFGAREMFTSNVLLIAGMEAPLIEVANLEELKEKCQDLGFACICSSPAIYGEWGDDAVAALREAGAKPLYIAGNPKELPTAEVDGNFAMGKDVVAQLTEILDELGVAK